MVRKEKNLESLDPHAAQRDAKARKQKHLTDNRKSIRLIARLASTPKHGKKTSPH